MLLLSLSILSAIFFPGIILRTKSIASGRKGPSILQPIKNCIVLFKKGSIFSPTTSYISQVAPIIYLATIICGILTIPFPGTKAWLSFNIDFVFLAYMLTLGKFVFIISALDTGSSFQGMGANREALYSMLAEPAFFILFATLALMTGHTSMHDIFSSIYINNFYYFIFVAIALYVIVQIAMIENSRMPVDDPKTHLELTMIHEVMILDTSGFDLAIIHIATWLKFTLYGSIIANFLIPIRSSLLLRIGVFFFVQIMFAVIIGILESFRARKKMIRNPQFIATLSAIALVAFILCVLLINNLIF